MKGKILEYSICDSKGIISAEDSNRYEFSIADWKSNSVYPKNGMELDFVPNEKVASEIYPIGEESSNIQQANVVHQQTSGAAIASLVFGILGLLASWWSLGIPSIIAVITGHIARGNIKRSQGKLGGDGLAMGGLIIGYLTILVYVIIAVFFIGLIGAMSQ